MASGDGGCGGPVPADCHLLTTGSCWGDGVGERGVGSWGSAWAPPPCWSAPAAGVLVSLETCAERQAFLPVRRAPRAMVPRQERRREDGDGAAQPRRRLVTSLSFCFVPPASAPDLRGCRPCPPACSSVRWLCWSLTFALPLGGAAPRDFWPPVPSLPSRPPRPLEQPPVAALTAARLSGRRPSQGLPVS